jgi:hypothetical protein
MDFANPPNAIHAITKNFRHAQNILIKKYDAPDCSTGAYVSQADKGE